MISPQSLRYFSKKNQSIYKNYLRKKPNKYEFLKLIKKGILPRPHYALGILMAAQQAKDLGYKSIKIMEFGCYNFDGILDLEHYANDINKFLNIKIKIFGFTLKKGLPNYKPNVYDRLHRWRPGDFSFTSKQNYKKIKTDKIYFGDVKKTINVFKKNYKNDVKCPIGFIIYDLDFYTSTSYAFNILKMKDHFYLPRIYHYFDDLSYSSEDEGERLAISQFNKKNKYKISDIGELAEHLSIFWNKWIFLGKRLKITNIFKHKKFNKKVEELEII